MTNINAQLRALLIQCAVLVGVLHILLPESSVAQPKVILGDTDIVQTYRLTSALGECDFAGGMLYGAGLFNRPIFFGWDSVHATAGCIGDRLGLMHDTANLTIYYYENWICRVGSQTFHLEANAIGISDSLVLIRPKSWTVDLYFDTITKEWSGSTSPSFLNNIAAKTSFSEWRLEGIPDSILHMEYGPAVDSNSLLQYTAGDKEKRRLDFHFRSAHGSSYDAVSYDATLLTHVQNAEMDSIYQNRITFVLHPVPFHYGANLSSQNAVITSPANSTSVAINPYPTPTEIVIEQPRAPFHVQFISHAKEDSGSLDTLIVTCDAATSGHYCDLVPIRYTFRDQVGNLYSTSHFLKIVANVNVDDPVEWQPTAFLPDAAFENLFILKDGTVCETGAAGFSYSNDSGVTWRTAPISGIKKVQGEVITYRDSTDENRTSIVLFGIKNSQLVRSLDTGRSWSVISYGLFVTAMQTRRLPAP